MRPGKEAMLAHNKCLSQPDFNGRPVNLRRQSTIYSHGMSVNVLNRSGIIQPDHDKQTQQNQLHVLDSVPNTNSNNSKSARWQTGKNTHPKFKINMYGQPENMMQLQVRRYKYPPSTKYCLDTLEPNTNAFLQLRKYYCQRKYLNWVSFLLVSALLFSGLVTYCIWIHNISVARSKYLKQRIQSEVDREVRESNSAIKLTGSPTAETVEIQQPTKTTEKGIRRHNLQESTLLRAISTRKRAKFREPKFVSLEYVDSEDPRLDRSKDKTVLLVVRQESTTMIAEEAVVAPEIILSSGDQNKFGVPIEKDKRILAIANGMFPTSSTRAMPLNSFAQVSPTIPSLSTQASFTSTSAATVPESGCYSTKLHMCRGVLDYDLTNNSSIKLSELELEAYQKLLRSNCSVRAAEFVCTALEPECRSPHIGSLPPCRRLCKAVFELCSILITSSDTLIATFDCSLYPDSNDPHRCEDPTRRRDFCFDKEFQCNDHSCIPSQWQCDNIKDCVEGEDEDDCMACQLDEFRCHSNEKCVSESMQCDQMYDCFDGSDEDGCDDYGSGEDPGYAASPLNTFPRFLYFFTATENDKPEMKYETEAPQGEEILKFDVISNSLWGEPKRFVNFHNRREIMMTSDSEINFKTSSTHINRSTSQQNLDSNTTPIQPAGSFRVGVITDAPQMPSRDCASHELRCVSGKCITVAQLCDMIIDCPDGSDEFKCVYKERSSTD